MDPMWNDYNKLSVKILSYLYLLKTDQDLNSSSSRRNIVNSNYQTPENCKFELSTQALV
jgi:hypothetical protein